MTSVTANTIGSYQHQPPHDESTEGLIGAEPVKKQATWLQASSASPLTPLGEIMRRDNQPSAVAAARTYAHETLGVSDQHILDIEPVGVADPNSKHSWLPMKIFYTNGKQPTAGELAALQQKAKQIGQLQLRVGADYAGEALTVIASGTSIQGARLAVYRATLDTGVKRAAAELAAKLAARQSATVGGATLVNAVRVAATDNLAKLQAALSEFNALYIRTYGIRSVVVR
jgi:hypothetical protein